MGWWICKMVIKERESLKEMMKKAFKSKKRARVTEDVSTLGSIDENSCVEDCLVVVGRSRCIVTLRIIGKKWIKLNH